MKFKYTLAIDEDEKEEVKKTKPTKEQLLAFAKNNNIDSDPVIDDKSAARHYKRQRDQYKRERDELIKDIDNIYKKSEVFAQEYVKMQDKNFYDGLKIDSLKDDNSRLNRQIKLVYKMAENYLRLKGHIREKAKHNPGNSRYIALVHFIDDLEDK